MAVNCINFCVLLQDGSAFHVNTISMPGTLSLYVVSFNGFWYFANCQKWVHKKCRGIMGSMSNVTKSFICRGCLNLVTSTGCTSVDIGASANLELVDKFCYFDDMLSMDRDADAAVEAIVRIGWNKLRHLIPLLTNSYMPLIMRGRLLPSVLRHCWLCGRKGIWPVKTECWMLAWLCVSIKVQICIWPC